MPKSSIFFDKISKAIFIRLSSSFYAMRILEDGRLLHVGAGALTADAPQDTEELALLEQYQEPNFNFYGQADRYELPTFGDVSLHNTAIKASFPDAPGKILSSESANTPVRDLRPRYIGHEVGYDNSPEFQPGLSPEHGKRTKINAPREVLALHLKDESYDFYMTLYYRITPEHDIIERWISLENQTAKSVEIEQLAFGALNLDFGDYELTRVSGAWGREFMTERQKLPQGTFTLDQRGINTGNGQNPFYLVSEVGKAFEDAGQVHFGALGYSGNWRLVFETTSTKALRIIGGYEPQDFGLSLTPGQSHTTPVFVYGVTDGGFGEASRKMHRFIRERVVPFDGEPEERPVLFNGWEAAYFDLSVQNQTEAARIASKIGVELFVVDDGWFGGRRNDHAGLGDWFVSPEVFPQGLTPLIDEVKNLGMKFGIWVEPEMVNPDSDLYRAHPDWVLHFPGRSRTESRNQLILDLGREEVYDYLFKALDTLLAENDISFFKWDMNRNSTEPGSVVGKAIWYKHVEALYHLMDSLREAHPNVSIQSCSGGGSRVDIGVLGRTDQVWTSDNTDAFDRTDIQDGFSLAYPPRTMECWVTHEVNHQTRRQAPLSMRFDVAMRGVLGIGSSLNELSECELAEYAKRISFYKTIRPIVHTGDLYRLRVEGGLSIWQIASHEASVVSIVSTKHLLGVRVAAPRLKALVSSADYSITDENRQELARISGFQLMTLGIPDSITKKALEGGFGSMTILVKKI
jgi:alpha-galactosidase